MTGGATPNPDPLAGVRLVVSDLDGTLLRDDRTVGPDTVAALERLAGHGIGFTVATGRPVRMLAPVLAALPAVGPVVCVNGAAVYDPRTRELTEHRPLPPEVLAELLDRLRRELPEAVFAAELDGGRRLGYEAAFRVHPATPGAVRMECAALARAPVSKLLVKLDGAAAAQLARQVRRSARGLAEVTHATAPGLVEVCAAGVDKAAALGRLAGRLGLRGDQAAAVGDMPNDLPMLAWAGVKVAVANAHAEVLRAATHHTASNNEDGVGRFIDRVLLQRGDATPAAAPG